MPGIIKRIEKALIRFVIGSLVIMVLVQGLMTSDPIRFYLSWGERMEGQNLELPVNNTKTDGTAEIIETVRSPQARLTIKANKYSSLPYARILVNGQEKYNFTNNKITVEIDAGDSIEIDSTSYNFPIDFEITAVSSNLAYPEQGQTYTANQTIVMVGKIIVK